MDIVNNNFGKLTNHKLSIKKHGNGNNSCSVSDY